MVHVEQIYTGCVAEAAYFIESNGECCVIDPLRETKPYTDRAAARHAKLKYVFETHFHADFVSGHVDLAKAAGATIVYGPSAEPKFEAHVAKDGEVFVIGGCTLTLLHTPGHTMESSCFVLKDENGELVGVFTGDTLFIGDVGRPDLAQKHGELTAEDLARHLFNSLRTKIMTLPDTILVYPGHGAGSACGKNMSKETVDTLAHQKATNYALRADMTVEEFTKEVLHGLHAPPAYFPTAVHKNKNPQEKSFDDILAHGKRHLSAKQLHELLASGTPPLVIDCRRGPEFMKGHIRGTVFTGLEDGSFAPWIATAVGDVEQPFVLIPVSEEKLEEALTRLSRFGFDNPIGHLHGGYHAWVEAGYPSDTMHNVDAEGLAKALEADPSTYVVDCRNPGEYNAAHLDVAHNIRMNAPDLQQVDVTKHVYAHCGSGYRSLIFLSLLRHLKGHEVKVTNVAGGFMAIKQNPVLSGRIVAGACSSAAHLSTKPCGQ